jgi:hypothetical protein
MCYFKEYLTIGTPKALGCYQIKLNPNFLHDLHHGETTTKATYIQKRSLPTLNGRLWGDFIMIY